jgi:SSS family solute:Na+ symporter
MVAGARLLNGVVPVSYEGALAAVALIFVLYTYWGGQQSVIKTDAWQLFLFAAGLLVCLGLVALSVRDGPQSLLDSVPADYFRFPVSVDFTWYDLLVFYPLVIGLPYLVGPDIYSRVLCARDNSVARRSALTAALVIIPVSLVLAILGIFIKARFPDISPEAALPTALGILIPVGVSGVVTAGFLAAVMSSADTTLVSAATILSLNVISNRSGTERARQLSVTRLGVLGVGVAAWLIAWLQQGIITSLLLGYTVFVGGVVFPTLASFCGKRAPVTSTGAMWAVVVGGSVALLGGMRQGIMLRALLGDSGDALCARLLGSEYESILPIVLSVLVMLTVSALDRGVRSRAERAARDASMGPGSPD